MSKLEILESNIMFKGLKPETHQILLKVLKYVARDQEILGIQRASSSNSQEILPPGTVLRILRTVI